MIPLLAETMIKPMKSLVCSRSPTLMPDADEPDWIRLGLQLIARAERYRKSPPDVEAPRSKVFSCKYARDLAAAEQPAAGWWWIYAPFVAALLAPEQTNQSLATWIALGRITSVKNQEWHTFYAADLRGEQFKGFTHAAAFNSGHPELAQSTMLLSAKLLQELQHDPPPAALWMGFASREPPDSHPSIVKYSLPNVCDVKLNALLHSEGYVDAQSDVMAPPSIAAAAAETYAKALATRATGVAVEFVGALSDLDETQRAMVRACR